jgi:hypothetical protein
LTEQSYTHFNVQGFTESQAEKTIAAVAEFKEDGSLFVTVMAAEFAKTNWRIRFKGPCGMN